jgi:AAA+ superfamily predicted ATPase
MLFYLLQAPLPDKMKEGTPKQIAKEYSLQSQLGSDRYFMQHDKSCYAYISSVDRTSINIGMAVDTTYLNDKDISSLGKEFLELLAIPCSGLKCTEITFSAFESIIGLSCQNDYIKDDNVVLKKLGLYSLDDRCFSETLISGKAKKPELCRIAKELLCDETLIPEINRIYKGCSANTFSTGHPVHYMIQIDNTGNREQAIAALLNALYNNRRIQSKRYSSIHFDQNSSDYSMRTLEEIWKSNTGGTVVIEYFCSKEYSSNYAEPFADALGNICLLMKKYKNRVLTLLCLPFGKDNLRLSFIENLGTLTLITITEGIVYGQRAKQHLKQIASKAGIKPDQKLYRQISDPKKGYRISELTGIYDHWYSGQLKSVLYPQYSGFSSSEKLAEHKKYRGSAFSQLNEMIGLQNAKKTIGMALDYFKAQTIFQDKNINQDMPSMHMVFTGNPGTAKTTVARLFSQIMKENGYLSVGNLIEVGRADLIGKYVGWTADIIKKKFEEAEGSVLFIDEAYALVDKEHGQYGDEAISTIVQCMENLRENLIVIFAGYPEPMETFINRNAGLKSRIAFHIQFDDYSPEELYDILKLMAKEKGLTLSADVPGKVLPILRTAVQAKDFGNGRFVRNMLEQAQFRQAKRLLSIGSSMVTEEEVHILFDEDFELPSTIQVCHRHMGF